MRGAAKRKDSARLVCEPGLVCGCVCTLVVMCPKSSNMSHGGRECLVAVY